jgi:hypothetical protein
LIVNLDGIQIRVTRLVGAAGDGWVPELDLVFVFQTEEAADEPSGRMPGCQSTHAGPCYGELWQCAACGKIVCFAEGSDNHPELCDACWCKRYAGQEDDDALF